MKRSFHIKSPAGPFDDPFLYLRFFHTGRAILLDLGDLTSLSPRDLLKVTDVFVSHMHMDHFAGFDRLLRLHLKRTERLRLYGPEGLLERIQGKLQGYTWNLTGNDPLAIVAAEADEREVRTAVFRAAHGFRMKNGGRVRTWTGTLLEEPGFQVKGAVLDHGIPCLGFRVEETLRVRILSGELESRGLAPGPWLSELKAAVVEGAPPWSRIRIRTVEGPGEAQLGEMSGIYRTSPGAVLAYVVDVADSSRNLDRILALAREADLLYIEAAFASRDLRLSAERGHLTAMRAGRIAAMAGVPRMRVIHLSPRYQGRERQILDEAGKGAGKSCRVEGGWRRWG